MFLLFKKLKACINLAPKIVKSDRNLQNLPETSLELLLIFSSFFFLGVGGLFPWGVWASLHALWLILTRGGSLLLATRCCGYGSKLSQTLEHFPVVDKLLGHTWWLLELGFMCYRWFMMFFKYRFKLISIQISNE